MVHEIPLPTETSLKLRIAYLEREKAQLQTVNMRLQAEMMRLQTQHLLKEAQALDQQATALLQETVNTLLKEHSAGLPHASYRFDPVNGNLVYDDAEALENPVTN